MCRREEKRKGLLACSENKERMRRERSERGQEEREVGMVGATWGEKL